VPVLEPSKTFRSEKPILLVENKLEPGRHLFELVCVDDAGNASKPAQIMVTVVEPPVFDRDPLRDLELFADPVFLSPITKRRPGD
jgi:hypothetical protein